MWNLGLILFCLVERKWANNNLIIFYYYFFIRDPSFSHIISGFKTRRLTTSTALHTLNNQSMKKIGPALRHPSIPYLRKGYRPRNTPYIHRIKIQPFMRFHGMRTSLNDGRLLDILSKASKFQLSMTCSDYNCR